MTEYIPVEKILELDQNDPELISQAESSQIAPPTNRTSENQQPLNETRTQSKTSDTEKPVSTADEKMVKFNLRCCRSDWFIVDGLGITCSTITYFLILFAEFVVIGVILLPAFPNSPWSYIHCVFFTFFAFMAAFSHLRAMTTNPVSRFSSCFPFLSIRLVAIDTPYLMILAAAILLSLLIFVNLWSDF